MSGGFNPDARAVLQQTLARVASDEPPFVDPPELSELLYWCEPSVVAHIEYGETGPGGQLHFGRYICLRHDMTPADSIAPVRVRAPKSRS